MTEIRTHNYNVLPRMGFVASMLIGNVTFLRLPLKCKTHPSVHDERGLLAGREIDEAISEEYPFHPGRPFLH